MSTGGRTRADAVQWVEDGTRRCSEVMTGWSETDFEAPSELPGWTRKHLVGHLAANAEAVANLITWARTGVETPMYTSMEQRNADIAAAVERSGADLRNWFEESAAALAVAFAAVTDEQWTTQVKTALGRDVPASEVPWMRAREVVVHAGDLGPEASLADAPEAFLVALVEDVVAKRSADGDGPMLTCRSVDTGHTWTIAGTGEPQEVTGTVAALSAYLTGRPGGPVVSDQGAAAPVLPRWI